MQIREIAPLLNGCRTQLSRTFCLVGSESNVSNFRSTDRRLLDQARGFDVGPWLWDLRAHEGVLGLAKAACREDAFLALHLCVAVASALRAREAPSVGTFL